MSGEGDAGGAGVRRVRIPAGGRQLDGDLVFPEGHRALVVFAHGSGSSRASPRNRAVADVLQAAGMATLLADLLTADEDDLDRRTAELRFDIALLARRLAAIVAWAAAQPAALERRIGLFGASTGAAAALMVAAAKPELVAAVVSRGGRPDLAGAALRDMRAPVLLIVGGDDPTVLRLNTAAQSTLGCSLAVVPGATHLFEEPGALESVARLAADHFTDHLASDTRPSRWQH